MDFQMAKMYGNNGTFCGGTKMRPDLGKRAYVVHTSNFAHLEICKNHKKWYTVLKLSGMIKE